MPSAMLQQQSPPPLPRFSQSESAAQKIIFPGQEEAEKQPARDRQNWFQYRFGKEHGFGSAVLLANMFSTSLQIKAGHRENDISRLVGGTLATMLNVWVFLSSRGGKPPKGETVGERVMDTIRHPSQSAVHFASLCSLIISAVFTSGHAYKGLTGDASERTRQLSAGLNFLSVCLMASGTFRNYRDKPQTADKAPQVKPVLFAESTSREVGGNRIKEVLQAAWQQDKRGLLGRCLIVGCQLADLRESLAKRKVSGKAPSILLTSALVDLAVQMGQSFYLYDRLERENRSKMLLSATKEQTRPIGR